MSDVGETISPVGAPFSVRVLARNRLRSRLDAYAFEELVRSNEKGLRQLAYRLLGSREEMEDALQDACLKAYRSQGQLRADDPAAAAAWLYRVAYRTCLDRIRQRRRHQMTPVEDIAAVAGAAPDHAEAIGTEMELAAALAQLTPELRAAVLLVDQLGFDYAAAAEILQVPAGTIGSRLTRARSELRLLLRLSEGQDTETKEVAPS